jgi:aromatic-L-amino-acid/L-tryptophan decarboxylase
LPRRPKQARRKPAKKPAARPALLLDAPVRARLWKRVFRAIEDYARQLDEVRVTPELAPRKIRSLLEPFDFSQSRDPIETADFLIRALWQFQTHTAHPRYYGLFNPAPATMGIAADTLAAAFNPQLAAWSHSPLAIEIERHLIRAFGERFGLRAADGTFCSGGAEANHTAVLTALARAFPEFSKSGVKAIAAQPALYVSAEGHHSFHKAARLCGLGTDAVREIPVRADLKMDVRALAARIGEDRRRGLAPFMAIATAGTTNAGAVDPIAEIAQVSSGEKLWLHVDAAWGGAAALAPELRGLLAGIERADSIAFDAHKWLSVPMGAGIYITPHQDILDRTFRVGAPYMPREARGLDVIDPCLHSIQWSRRAIGLKVFLSLAVAGWDGYAATIRHMVAMGDCLREELRRGGWEVVNRTPLPLVCFVDSHGPLGRTAEYLDRIALEVVRSGEAWISTTRLSGRTPVLRACITNYRTTQKDIQALGRTLAKARKKAAGAAP